MRDCIDAMVTAMTGLTRGTIAVPSRIIMPLVDQSGYFAVMPGSASEPLVYGAKLPDEAPFCGGEGVVGGAHVGKLGLAAFLRDGVGG